MAPRISSCAPTRLRFQLLDPLQDLRPGDVASCKVGVGLRPIGYCGADRLPQGGPLTRLLALTPGATTALRWARAEKASQDVLQKFVAGRSLGGCDGARISAAISRAHGSVPVLKVCVNFSATIGEDCWKRRRKPHAHVPVTARNRLEAAP